jgi:YHS domain-containing protein
VAIYRKYYGTAFALRIVALMLVAMVLAALAVDGLFSALGLVPTRRPSAEGVFGAIEVDYKLALNALATVAFVALWALTRRRGATDPVCGMTVDRSKAITLEAGGRTVHFCSEHCRQAYLVASEGEGARLATGPSAP